MITQALPQSLARYQDPKRYWWLLSLFVPVLLAAGPLAYLVYPSIALLWLPVVAVYVLIPLLDWFIGEDTSNPPEVAVPQLESDHFYRYITYALVPILWGAIIFSAWFVSHQVLPWYGVLAVVLTTGMSGGFCINVGHELGHKRTTLEKRLAQCVLAPTGYGHFYIEHNFGHHRDVATPSDPASSRMGEHIYQFMLREMPGGLRRAWQVEVARLTRRHRSVWSWHNEVLQPLCLTIALWAGLVAWLGVGILPFMLAVSFWANFQLTSANYIEHYGLLRQSLTNGQPEVCQPHHSWNSNHAVSNWVLFHLQRHSDHHAHATRRYQSLRHFSGLPTLPSGYFGMFTLAYVPPVWFAVMDKRLIAAVGGDASCINFQPSARARLMADYQLKPAPAVPDLSVDRA